jgi:hypothetical protein
MKNLFTVFVLIAVSVLFFISYYAGKNILFKYKTKKIKSRILKKRHNDEKSYIRNYLRTQIKKLESGEVHWILIYSRLYPEQKVEIIFDFLEGALQAQVRSCNINSWEMEKLKKLGMSRYFIREDLCCFNMPVNSTIITDIIYYILEEFYNQKCAKNFKVVTSEGSL